MKSLFHALLTTALAATLSNIHARAASQAWDAAVNSNWDTSTANWSGAAWTQGNQAVFGASAVMDATHPFLSGIFSDNMVLQRGVSDPFWGWTTPGSAVTVRVAGSNIQATGTAGGDGKWQVNLPAPPVGGPYTIQIDGPQSVTLGNVLCGEVWLCTGQSNMWLPVSACDNATAEIAAANYPNIRLVTPNGKIGLSPSTQIDGVWQACSPTTIPNFSAVAYYFGRKLYQDLNVPIGLIGIGWGGTSIETWSSAQSNTQVQPALQADMAMLARAAGGEDLYAAWYPANDPGSVSGSDWSAPAFDDSSWASARLPNLPVWSDLWGLYDPPYTGTIWFRNTFALSAVKGDMTLNFQTSNVDTVWVNGVNVGNTMDTNFRRYTIPEGVLKAGTNSMVFRFLQTSQGFPAVNCTAEQFTLVAASGVSQSLAGQWKYHLGVALAVASPLPFAIGQNTPSVVYNGMVAPLAPFAIKGNIWYQGEANTGTYSAGYRQQLTAMIGGWRSLWSQGDFPFYVVQLPKYGGLQGSPSTGDVWVNQSAEIRESQAVAAAAAANSGLAVTLELGDAADAHPTHKQEVGRRLALLALAKTYGQNVVASGPIYSSMEISGSTIHLNFNLGGSPLAAAALDANSQPALNFNQAGSPLTVTTNTDLKGFVIAGADKNWQWATATIVGNQVVVSSPQVASPVAVRYAWAANPINNLINQAGLPASTFRTDNWPLVSLSF
jgi:sialate O-acetylesterase